MFFRGDVDQQRHPGLLAVRVWVTGLGGAFACYVSLFATFETDIDASKMRSFVVGKFPEFRRLGFSLESIDLDGVRCVIVCHTQGIQLHRFAADVFLVGRLRGIEEWSVIDDGIEAVRNSIGLFKDLRISKFDFRACLGL